MLLTFLAFLSVLGVTPSRPNRRDPGGVSISVPAAASERAPTTVSSMSHISHGDPPRGDKRTIATAHGRGVGAGSPPCRSAGCPVTALPELAPPSPLCDTCALPERFPTLRAPAALRDSPNSPTVTYHPRSPLTRHTGLSHRASPIPSLRAAIPRGPDPTRTPGVPTEGMSPTGIFIFSRRCSLPLGCIYFFVDRRGSQSPGLSETITSHSRYLLPHKLGGNESKGTHRLGAPGQISEHGPGSSRAGAHLRDRSSSLGDGCSRSG